MNPDVRIRPSVSGLFASRALLPTGWADDVRLDWARSGRLVTVEAGSDPEQAARDGLAIAPGPVMPGRAAVGARSGRPLESAGHEIGVADLEQLAMADMVGWLEAGVTSVCEIHACHSLADPGHEAGLAADARWAMSLAHAAGAAGIGLTLMPAWSAPGTQATASVGPRMLPTQPSRRIVAVDRMLGLLAGLKPQCDPLGVRVGLCVLAGEDPQSAGQAAWQAVARHPDPLIRLLGGLDALDRDAPLHWLGSVPAAWAAVLTGRTVQVHRLPAGLGAADADPGRRDLPAAAGQDVVDAALLGDGRMLISGIAEGAQAAGRAVAGLAVGQQADLVCVRDGGDGGDQSGAIDEVWCGGRLVVTAGRHDLHEVARAARADVLGRLRPLVTG